MSNEISRDGKYIASEHRKNSSNGLGLDDLPTVTLDPRIFVRSEHQLYQIIDEVPNFWLRLGCQEAKVRTTTSPDYLAQIRNTGATKEYLGVEVKMTSTGIDFSQINRGTHVILTFMAPSWRRELYGRPVISFYRRREDKWYRWSLDEDISHVFGSKKLKHFPIEDDVREEAISYEV